MKSHNGHDFVRTGAVGTGLIVLAGACLWMGVSTFNQMNHAASQGFQTTSSYGTMLYDHQVGKAIGVMNRLGQSLVIADAEPFVVSGSAIGDGLSPTTHTEAPSTTSESDALTRSMTYIIERGDTLSRISGAFGVPLDVLVRVNEIPDPNLIYTGASLWIPVHDR